MNMPDQTYWHWRLATMANTELILVSLAVIGKIQCKPNRHTVWIVLLILFHFKVNLRGSQYVNTISINEQMSSKMSATNYDCPQPVIVLYVEPKWNLVIDCDKKASFWSYMYNKNRYSDWQMNETPHDLRWHVSRLFGVLPSKVGYGWVPNKLLL